GAGGLEVPARELPAPARGARGGPAADGAPGVRPGRPQPGGRDREEVHPAGRGDVRLRPDVHPGRERVLRGDRAGRGRGGRGRPSRLRALAPGCSGVAELVLRLPPGHPARPQGASHRAERAGDPGHAGWARRRPRPLPGAFRDTRQARGQRQEQVRGRGDGAGAVRGEAGEGGGAGDPGSPARGAMMTLATSPEWTVDEHGALTETRFADLPLVSRGKVRDIYDLGQELLIVTTDRISA